jgi:hypothetical protein
VDADGDQDHDDEQRDGRDRSADTDRLFVRGWTAPGARRPPTASGRAAS